MIVSSVSPGTSSITSAAMSSDSSKSYTCAMWGWLSDASRRASRSNRARLSALRVSARGDFDRHVARESSVARAIDLAHAARADARVDLVDAQTASGQVHVRLGMVAHQECDLLDSGPLHETVGGVL